MILILIGRLKKSEDRESFDQIEREFSYEAIMNARLIARTELKNEEITKKEEYKKSSYISSAYMNTTATVSWLSSWVWTPSDISVDDLSKFSGNYIFF